MTSILPTRLGEGPFAIATRSLTSAYGKIMALADVNLQVPEGAVYVLIGPNGAGKTTLLKVLLDLVRADSGDAEVFGLNSREHGPAVRARVGYVPEGASWGYGWMRVQRLLQHHATYYPTWDSEYAARLAKAFDLGMDQKFGKLSKGQARRVHLVMALAHRPPVLLLDEPTDGLDPVMRDETLGLLADHLAQTGATMLISTHLVHETEKLADHIGVLRGGEMQAQMNVHDLRRGLRRYRAEVPDGWAGSPTLNGSVLRRQSTPNEIQWTVWGEESDVLAQLKGSGAIVREASAVSLEDAALAMLSRKE